MIRKLKGIEVNLPSQITINDLTTEDITGTATETPLSAVLVPGGTFATGDVIGIETRLRTSGTEGGKTIRIRIGTGTTISEELAAVTSSASDLLTFLPLSRMMVIKEEDGTGDGTEFNTTTRTVSSDIGDSFSSLSVIETLTTDWTIDNYITVTGQLEETGDV